MKRIALVTSFVFLALGTKPVLAADNVCNLRCDVDQDCGKGYKCYVGVCRNQSCPSSTSCACADATPTPRASATPVSTVVSTPTPKPTPSPKATPTATSSATVKKTPQTGSSMSVGIALAFVLAAVGVALKGNVVHAVLDQPMFYGATKKRTGLAR